MTRIALLLLLLLLTNSASATEVLSGKVVHIADGDTITILDSSRSQHKIRLYGIDTPEIGQAFGKTAQKFTAKLTANEIAHVVSLDTDRYGRTVGIIVVNGVNVNQSIIEAGYAWHYGKYCKEPFCDEWLKLEKRARYLKKGLWADSEAKAPWEWRNAKRNATTKYKPRTYSLNNSSIIYHGNVRSHVFHGERCRHYNCKNCVKDFRSKQAALNSGYRPHHECVD